ncbi:putative allantoate permease of the major facilitator superfamily [Talaromyces stipitatus ATCC 10500]|uniref:Putative allantoate permease of the major facilitator superfamily n=1 Tax=Talaromyces stipitatus (strain ATCC 10500 / CBS 375.48 / QM 6759 / NRRL 1006) TaxID=441959 RepID=B8M7U5_TALSN|nr:putative allantoate permease of the major facilitator superfamily [Talaromyces stipitatus ATCC 10500]EED19824.1 putative allantoate permease of the major facilitator superfamily [Talaromyces stipitatus ATCC 10500]
MSEKTANLKTTVNAEPANINPVVSKKYADVTLEFVELYGDSTPPLTEKEEKKLSRKLFWYIILLLTITNLLLFIDKSTLSYASLLGIFEETHLNGTQYNNLNTLFYVGYIVGQFPGHYLMQRLPLGKYVSGTTFFWALIIFLHDTARSYGGLIPLRFFLGFVESSLVPAMEITLGMFFPPEEQSALQPLFWISCMGANIPTGFIAYGLLYSKSSILPWKFLMIITGSLSLFLSIFCWFFYPDNPVQAKFLSRAEKLHTIKRVHDATKGSIEQKQFKRYQAIETIRDPVSWLFLLQVFTLMLSNNLAYQQNLLFLSLGVSNLGSTLVGVASAGFSVVCCVVAYFLLRWFPNKNAYWSVLWVLPAIAGGIGMVTVPWDNKIGLLACLCLAGATFGITYIIALGWTTSTASGYTKKLLRNVMFMVGYSIANIISPQIWAARDAPRYYPAWIVQIVISWVGTPVILLVIRFILSRRNKERRAWILQQQASRAVGVVKQVDDEGQVVQTTVDLAFLDLTDLENKYFIYPL